MGRKVLTVDEMREKLAGLPGDMEVWCLSLSVVDGDEDTLHAAAEGVAVRKRGGRMRVEIDADGRTAEDRERAEVEDARGARGVNWREWTEPGTPGLLVHSAERVEGIGCQMRLRVFLNEFFVEFDGTGLWRVATQGPGTPESEFPSRERAEAYMARVRTWREIEHRYMAGDGDTCRKGVRPHPLAGAARVVCGLPESAHGEFPWPTEEEVRE